MCKGVSQDLYGHSSFTGHRTPLASVTVALIENLHLHGRSTKAILKRLIREFKDRDEGTDHPMRKFYRMRRHFISQIFVIVSILTYYRRSYT